jgi:Protein of unknown function (DUF3489)
VAAEIVPRPLNEDRLMSNSKKNQRTSVAKTRAVPRPIVRRRVKRNAPASTSNSRGADIPDAAKTTKLDRIVALLQRPDGAGIAELCKTTGWQAHSVRGALAGTLKHMGYVITSSKVDKLRRYRIGEHSRPAGRGHE